MKIFHMGDWHIGKLVNGFYMTEDQEFIINQLYDEIEKEEPDVLIIAGDLYDRSVPPVQAVELLNKVLKKIVVDLKTPIIAIAGNHDSNERLGFGSELLKSSGLYIKGTLSKEVEKITLRDKFGEVDFYPIPYLDPPIVRDLYEDESIKTHDDAMKKIVENIREHMDKEKRNVSIAHGYITYTRGSEEEAESEESHVDSLEGIGNQEENTARRDDSKEKSNEPVIEELEKSDSEKPLSIGGTEVINADYFRDFNYTALGHLHGPQKVGSDRIRYSGSLMKYSFSEIKQKKGITIVNLDEAGNVKVDFHGFKHRRDFRIVTGELQDIVSGNIGDTGNKEDYIKVELKDKGELVDPMAKLRSVYPNVMELIRSDRVKSNGDGRIVATNVKERSKISLFESFYEDITGESCEEEYMSVMRDVIEKCERGGIEE